MRDITKNEAERLVNKYGLERAVQVATGKAMGAMTDDSQQHWWLVAAIIKEMSE